MLVTHLLNTILAAGAAAGAKPPVLSIDTCELGEVAPFALANCEAALSNMGDKPIHVFGLKALGEGMAVAGAPVDVVVPAHGKAYLSASLRIGNTVGAFGYALRIETDELGHIERSVRAYGFALSDVDQAKPEINLGVANLSTTLPRKSIALSSNVVSNFHLTAIREKPDWLDAKIIEGNSLEVTARADAPLGLQDGYVKVGINSPRQKEVWVNVLADVHGDVVPGTNPVDMGLMRYGNQNQFLVRLTSTSGKVFKIGKLELKDIKGDVQTIPCLPAAENCKMVRITISDKQPSGTVKGDLWVDLPDLHQRLPVRLGGIIVAKDFKIGSIGDQGSSSAVSPVEKPLDLAASIKSNIEAARTQNEPPPTGSGPLLKWSIANGLSVYGFQIFRATEEQGPFSVMTSPPIKAIKSNDTLTYQWRDTSAELGRTYWYYIGVVNQDGTKQQLSGAQKATAK